MAIAESEIQSLVADKDEIRRIVEEQYRLMGIPTAPSVTIEEMQATVAESLQRAGIRPEDCDASRAIIAARDDY